LSSSQSEYLGSLGKYLYRLWWLLNVRFWKKKYNIKSFNDLLQSPPQKNKQQQTNEKYTHIVQPCGTSNHTSWNIWKSSTLLIECLSVSSLLVLTVVTIIEFHIKFSL
jgi:hypothetical protein